MLREKLKHYNLKLASKSPRRLSLLKGLDVDFDLLEIDVEEVWPNDITLLEIPEYLAKLKSKAAIELLEDKDIVITADTAVFLDDEILNKPQSRDNAISMIKRISGNMHKVNTGVCIASKEKRIAFNDTTEVYFNSLNIGEIEYYLNNYEPYDKAGSYGAQDWIGYIGINKLVGSYYNVMGLPVRLVYRALMDFI